MPVEHIMPMWEPGDAANNENCDPQLTCNHQCTSQHRMHPSDQTNHVTTTRHISWEARHSVVTAAQPSQPSIHQCTPQHGAAPDVQ